MKPTTKEIKEKLKSIENEVMRERVVEFMQNPLSGFESTTVVYITDYFIKKCKKGKVWNTPALLVSLQNCRYEVDNKHLKSPGGRDGIFVIDRDYKPRNEMQKKIFDRFIDNDNSMFPGICQMWDKTKDDFIAVRIVSHHLRLLGVMFVTKNDDGRTFNVITLVDYDNTK